MTRGDRLFLLGLALALILVYGPGLGSPGAYDDVYVEGFVKRHASLRGTLEAFRSPLPVPRTGMLAPDYAYRPLSELSLALNRRIFPGPAMGGLRLGNLALHGGCAVLVFLLARRLGPADSPGFARWAAAFFAVHPLSAVAASYVYQRSVLQAAFLQLLCLHLVLADRRRAAWIAGLLAMTSKETAVALPLVLAAAEWIRGTGPGRFRRWLPFALLPVLPLIQVVRGAAEAEGTLPGGAALQSGFRLAEGGLSPWEYLRVELPTVLGYLRTAALPFPLHFYHDHVLSLPGLPFPVPAASTALCGLALASGTAWVLLGPRRHALPRLGLGLFLAPLALESSVFPIQDTAFLHRCYPALPGAALGFALLAGRLKPGLPAAALGLLLLGARGENRAWGDPPGMLVRDVRHAFHRGSVWSHHGWRLLETGHDRGALRMFETGLKAHWKRPQIVAGYVTVLTRLGRLKAARACAAQALREFPRDLLVVQAAMDAAAGDPAWMEEAADRAQALPFLDVGTAILVARHRVAQGRLGEAELVLSRALADFPGEPLLEGALREVRSRMPGSESPSVGGRSGRS